MLKFIIRNRGGIFSAAISQAKSNFELSPYVCPMVQIAASTESIASSSHSSLHQGKRELLNRIQVVWDHKHPPIPWLLRRFRLKLKLKLHVEKSIANFGFFNKCIWWAVAMWENPISPTQLAQITIKLPLPFLNAIKVSQAQKATEISGIIRLWRD